MKGRSRVSDLFDLSSIESDFVALVGIPSDLADVVSEAERLLDFATPGRANYDPVVILGLVEQSDIEPESHTLHLPAPDGPQIEQHPLQPAGQLPTGIAIGDWLRQVDEFTFSDDKYVFQQYEGIRQFDTSSNGQILYPGALVTPTDKVGLHTGSEEFPARGLVVECPDRPAGTTFNERVKRYQPSNGTSHGRIPAVGVIGIEQISEKVRDDIGQLCEQNVHPAVSQVVYNNNNSSLVEFTGASAVKQVDHIRGILFRGENPLSESWWSSAESQ